MDKKTLGYIAGFVAAIWLFSDPASAGDAVGTGIKSMLQAVEAMFKAASTS